MSFVVLKKQQKLKSSARKKIKFLLFLTKPQKISLIYGNNSVVIDFHKNKKIEMRCNTWKKEITCCSLKTTKFLFK
jgi:hypothetical protein